MLHLYREDTFTSISSSDHGKEENAQDNMNFGLHLEEIKNLFTRYFGEIEGIKEFLSVIQSVTN